MKLFFDDKNTFKTSAKVLAEAKKLFETLNEGSSEAEKAAAAIALAKVTFQATFTVVKSETANDRLWNARKDRRAAQRAEVEAIAAALKEAPKAAKMAIAFNESSSAIEHATFLAKANDTAANHYRKVLDAADAVAAARHECDKAHTGHVVLVAHDWDLIRGTNWAGELPKKGEEVRMNFHVNLNGKVTEIWKA